MEAVKGPVRDHLKILQDQAQAMVGDEDIDSPANVSRILFEKLKLPIPPGSKILKSGLPSTDKKILKEIDHDFARLIVLYRQLKKQIETIEESFERSLNKSVA